MRLRNIPGSKEVIAESEYVIHEPETVKGKWRRLFGNEKPLFIEIGMGKGRFIMDMAKAYPDINFVGIERYSSVLLRALQKMDEIEEKPENIRFICMDAKDILDVFDNGEADRIYLNFSDPWPKDRHAKRRLPSREFLKRFDVILSKDGTIEFKTDNKELFDFAVSELEPAGWKADVITYDLHADKELSKDNIMTEYEEKFSSIGNPICKYIIRR
ncbi:MAG: tRNA (guanosine(46)-N7)-methyltransferase TrmB [Lachnospiraceae bacterium]|nr:tRNA (guanosine(46)-N7)-methyltransferase TrmB [Lachnospiraceae bacterium]